MMEDRESNQAVFSTANGKYSFREARRLVRPIFREDSCSSDDAKDMAQSLQNDFPEQCKLMTAATARHIEDYFDPVDIQMQSRAFLQEVLMHIVLCNFQQARRRVQEYVDKVSKDPSRFERLKIEDLETHVFTEEEQNLVGYDNTLPAALVILKQSKFSQAFRGFAGYRPDARPNASVVPIPDTAGNDAEAAKVAHIIPEHSSQIDDRVVPVVELHSQPNDTQSLGNTNLSEEFTLQSRHSNHRPLSESSITSRTSFSNRKNPLSRLEALQASQNLMPIQNSLSTSQHGGRRNVNSRSHDLIAPPPPHNQQMPVASKAGGGIPNPIKKISDDIRQQKFATDVQNFPVRLDQDGWTPTVPKSGQISITHHPGYFPQVPNRTNFTSFKAPFEPNIHNSSAAENPTESVEIDSRLDLRFARPELGQIQPHYATETLDPSQPRNFSNPFPCKIFEALEHGDEDKNHALVLKHNSQQESDQETYDSLDRSRTDECVSTANNVLAHHRLSVDTYCISESAYPRHLNQRSDLHPKVSGVSIPAPPVVFTGPQLPVFQGHQVYTKKYNGSGRFSAAHSHPGIAPFSPQLDCVQNAGRIHLHKRQDDHRSPSAQYISRNQRNGYPSFQKPHVQEQRVLPFPDNCALFISGLPSHFETRDMWGMLSPVPGLKWISCPRQAVGKEYASSRIIFHEPWLAAEALMLLPKTHFPAMQGRFLVVRPSEPKTGPPPRLENLNSAIRPGSLYDASLTYCVPLLQKDKVTESSNDEKSRGKRPSISEPGHQMQKTSEEGRTTEVNMDIESNHEVENERAGADFEEFCQVQPCTEVTETTSVVSNGSPVRRKKSKWSTTSKTSRSKSMNVRDSSTTHLSKDKSNILKDELCDLVLEAAEADAGEPVQTKQSVDEELGKPVEHDYGEAYSSDLPMPQTRITRAAGSHRKRDKNRIEDEFVVKSSGRRRSSIVSIKVPLPLTRPPLNAASEDHGVIVHLANSSKASHLSEAEPQVTHFAEGTTSVGPKSDNARRDREADEDASQRTSLRSDLHRNSSETSGRKPLNAANPEHLIANSADAHSRVDVLKHGVDRRAFRASSPDLGRLTGLRDNKKKRVLDAGPVGIDRRTETTVTSQNSTVPSHQEQLLILPVPRANSPSASDPVSHQSTVENAAYKRMPMDVLPNIAMVSSSAEGDSSAMPMSPITQPTTTFPTERANTPSAGLPCPPEGTEQDCDKYRISSDVCVDSEYLRKKFEDTDMYAEGASNSTERLPDGDFDLPRHFSKSRRNNDENNERIQAQCNDTYHKQSSKTQKETKNRTSGSELLPSDDNSGTSCHSNTERHIQDANLPIDPPLAFVERQAGPHIVADSDDRGLAGLKSVCESTNHREQQDEPSRTTSIVRSLTPAPVVTRKKKQKEAEQTTTGQDDTAIAPFSTLNKKENREEGFLTIAPNDGNYGEKGISIEAATMTEYTSDPSSRNELKIFHDTKSDSAQSLQVLTPPTTPHPKSRSSLELSPITPLSLRNGHPETPRKISNTKSKNNRKKNRPGKKKPKLARKSRLDVDALGFNIVDENVPISSIRSCTDNFMSDKEEKIQSKSKKFKAVEDFTHPQNHGIGNQSDEESKRSFCSKPMTNNDLQYENGDELVVKNFSSSLRLDSEDSSLREIHGRPSQTAGKPVSTSTEKGIRESIAVRELLSRSYTAAIARIEDLCRMDDQIRTQTNIRLSTETIQDNYNGRLCFDCAKSQHVNGQQQTCKTLSDVERTLALDRELHWIVREAVQMGCPFVSDEDDREKGKLLTPESNRAQRILKTAHFLEESPLKSKSPIDMQRMNLWCNEATDWLQGFIPRLTQEQKIQMSEWEKSNPSLEKNLAALGFSVSETERLMILFLNGDGYRTNFTASESTSLEDHKSNCLNFSSPDAELSKRKHPEKQDFCVADSVALGMDTLQRQGEEPGDARFEVQDLAKLRNDEGIRNAEKTDGRENAELAGGGIKMARAGLQLPNDASTKTNAAREEVINVSQHCTSNLKQLPGDRSGPTEIESNTTPEKNQSEIQEQYIAAEISKANQVESETSNFEGSSTSNISLAKPPTTQSIIAALPKLDSSSPQSERTKASIPPLPKSIGTPVTIHTSSSPSPRTPASTMHALPNPKLSYATALQSPAPAAKIPSTDGDAWAVDGDEAWGSHSHSNNGRGEVSRAGSAGKPSPPRVGDEGKRRWSVARKKKGSRGQ